MHLTNIINKMYHSIPSQPFELEMFSLKTIDLCIPNVNDGNPIPFFLSHICTNSTVLCPLSSFSVVIFKEGPSEKTNLHLH